MNDHFAQYASPEIKLASFSEKYFSNEIFLDQHVLVWIISGEAKLVTADQSRILYPGDVILFPRYQLATFINYPKDDRNFQSVVLNLTVERLKAFYIKNDIRPQRNIFRSRLWSLPEHPLLNSFLASLMPYFEMKESLPENIASVKVEEAINILRIIKPEIDELLANFEEPGKINLTEFMEKNYMFNIDAKRFAYLTGRSISTFKRDFKKAYKTTPQRWLTKKRLEFAHYLIREKKRKPVDVYIEAGFENLSHFSYAFKKLFGYSPGVKKEVSNM